MERLTQGPQNLPEQARCPNCGYVLGGLPIRHKIKCPECGEASALAEALELGVPPHPAWSLVAICGPMLGLGLLSLVAALRGAAGPLMLVTMLTYTAGVLSPITIPFYIAWKHVPRLRRNGWLALFIVCGYLINAAIGALAYLAIIQPFSNGYLDGIN